MLICITFVSLVWKFLKILKNFYYIFIYTPINKISITHFLIHHILITFLDKRWNKCQNPLFFAKKNCSGVEKSILKLAKLNFKYWGITVPNISYTSQHHQICHIEVYFLINLDQSGYDEVQKRSTVNLCIKNHEIWTYLEGGRIAGWL